MIRRVRGWCRRGNTAAVVAVGLFFVVIVVNTVRYFVSRPEPKPPPSLVYLSDEQTVMNLRSPMLDASAAALRGDRVFSRIFGSRVFGSGTGLGSVFEGVGAHRDEVGNIVASHKVRVRLFGTPQGDFLFHSEHGWLHYMAGSWRPVAVRDLPEGIRKLYPRYCLEPERKGRLW